jgi:hypothetical protein
MSVARVCTATALTAIVALSATDPAVGMWKLNTDRSRYNPGPPPRSATVTYQQTDDRVTRTGKTTEADGTTTSFQYTAKYDGADYPVMGSRHFDAISLKRISDRIVEATLKKRGRVVRTARRVVSPDGKNLTITTTSADPTGQQFRNTAIYDRQ